MASTTSASLTQKNFRKRNLSESSGDDDDVEKSATFLAQNDEKTATRRTDSQVPPKKRKFAIPDSEDKHEEEIEEVVHPPDESKIVSSEKMVTSDFAQRMMAKMGHIEGKGLGAKNQGRAAPITAELRLGRAGLGAKKTGLEPSFDVTWDSSREEIIVEETIDWMPECPLLPPSAEDDDLQSWIRVGDRVTVIDNETEFCSPEILNQMLDAKSVFDELNDRDLRNARARANPFESIKGAIFQNRAAMKMANMDAVFDFELTEPTVEKEGRREPLVPRNGQDLFYFADVCAGPGGFTEYLLWKRNEYSAHGFGFTLRGKDDFKLDNFLSASPEYFETYYGQSGNDGDGDVMKEENLQNFQDLVMKVTNNKGVHLFMADGGFSVEGQENIQEILSKRLYLCQILCAFRILAVGGNLVCKLFDVFTPFSAGLLYLMWRCFDKVCLHKPHTSRPANSERYVLCMGYRDDTKDVIEHLKNANLKYEEIEGDKSVDVLDLVPMPVLQQSKEFCEYLTQSNEKMAVRQTLYLHKYKAFARNKMLQDSRQSDLREKCLEYWKVPDSQRPENHYRESSHNRFSFLCQNDTQWVNGPATQLGSTIEECDFNQYRCSVVSSNPTIVLALGKRFVFSYDVTSMKFDMIDQTFKVNIPKDTIVFGEFTYEYKNSSTKNQQRIPILRIFDAFCLNGKQIGNIPYRERLNQIKKFCHATSLEFSRSDITVPRPAEVYKLPDLRAVTKRFEMKHLNRAERLACKSLDSTTCIEVKKLLFYRILIGSWKIFWSKSNHRLYFFNTETKQSVFEGRPEMFADFRSMHVSRQLGLTLNQHHSDSMMCQVENFVHSILEKKPVEF